MKKLVIAFFLCFFSITNAQNLNDWQVGVNLSPFIFSRINPKFHFQKDRQNFPNGLGYGLTIEKNWNEHWGFKTGFETTKQNEKYFFNTGNTTKIKSSFEYYKVPLTIQYYYSLNEKLFLTFNQGIQLSNLKYFKTVIKDDYQMITLSSNYVESIFFEHPEQNNQNYGYYQDNLHNKNLFGIIGSIGLKGYLTNKISYSTNLRYEFDINSSDNLPYYSATPNNTKPEGTTHNFRLGLELGLQYHFSLDFVRFDNRPHKM
jgi:hypothetical protein